MPKETIIERDISAVQIDVICKFCKKGFMYNTGKKIMYPVVLVSNHHKPGFSLIHQCKGCGREYSIKGQFPMFKYLPNQSNELPDEDVEKVVEHEKVALH